MRLSRQYFRPQFVNYSRNFSKYFAGEIVYYNQEEIIKFF